MPSKELDLTSPDTWHATIVGGGLAGLTAAATILEKAGKVLIVEKEAQLGGNSIKDHSGINAVTEKEDSLDQFKEDIIQSAGEAAHPELIEALVDNSKRMYSWVEFKSLKNRVLECLNEVDQTGGHSKPRTHRSPPTKPAVGFGKPTPLKPAGEEITSKTIELINSYVEQGTCTLWLNTECTLVRVDSSGRVEGICFRRDGGETQTLACPNVLLATGGFLADRSPESPLAKNRPELVSAPSTSGSFSTGSGLTLATSLKAHTVDMEKIQIQPTGFVDPADPTCSTKVLAPEVFRAIGGILLKDDGTRFCNELERCNEVTEKVLQLDTDYAESKTWKEGQAMPQVHLLLSSEAAEKAGNLMEPYVSKGLMTKVTGLSGLAEHLKVSKDALQSTLKEYKAAADEGTDAFGKTVFKAVPPADGDDVEYYAATVTPVLHHCLGGIKIDQDGHVIGPPMKTDKKDEKKEAEESNEPAPIKGLYACGEVAGGVHGDNLLEGNAILECVVYGRLAAESICKTTKPRLMY